MSKITKENTPKTSNDEASEIIKKIIGLHEKHKGEKKYYLNVIEECRAYENAHTRILLKLFI